MTPQDHIRSGPRDGTERPAAADQPRCVTVDEQVELTRADRSEVFEFGRSESAAPGEQRLQHRPLGGVVHVVERIEIGRAEPPRATPLAPLDGPGSPSFDDTVRPAAASP